MRYKDLRIEDVQKDVVVKSSVVLSFRTHSKYRDFVKRNDIDLKRLFEKVLDELMKQKEEV